MFEKITDVLKELKFKFEGVTPTSGDSKLYLDIRVSLDAPGDNEALLASILNTIIGLGNSQKSSDTSKK